MEIPSRGCFNVLKTAQRLFVFNSTKRTESGTLRHADGVVLKRTILPPFPGLEGGGSLVVLIGGPQWRSYHLQHVSGFLAEVVAIIS